MPARTNRGTPPRRQRLPRPLCRGGTAQRVENDAVGAVCDAHMLDASCGVTSMVNVRQVGQTVHTSRASP